MAHGSLVLAATPIGNLADASPRLTATLAGADVIAAEDTRRLRRLLSELELAPKAQVVSYHDHNEAARALDLLEAIRSGSTVVVVTDAGMPSVSDPGFRIVAAAVAEGLPVTVIPGPSAVLAALAVSGLPVDRFCFEGFLPRKAGERRAALAELAQERRTMVFFEAPHRLGAALADCADHFGPERQAVVCRELTKTYEEVVRGSLQELAAWAIGEVRGEITLVVAGGELRPPSLSELVATVRQRVAAGERMATVCGDLARGSGISKRELYAATLADGGDGRSRHQDHTR